MTKHRLEGSMKYFGNHIDPEKDEQLKWVKIDVENKVKRILKLAKGINGNKDGNKDGNLKKKSEIIHLVEDFHQHYESLYSLYEELRGDLKNGINYVNDGSSASHSDSESYYSPEELNVKIPNDNQKAENLELEDAILKDKLTSSSELKEGSQSFDSSEVLKDVAVQEDELENTRWKLEGLEGEVTRLKVEIETLCERKRELEDQVEFRSDELSRLEEQNKSLQVELSTLKEQLCCEKKERSSEVEGLIEKVSTLQQELKVVNIEKDECLLEIENLRNELRNRDVVEKEQRDFEKEVRALSSDKSDLEEQIRRINEETYRSEVEKQELQRKLSDQKKKLKACEDESSAQIKFLKEKVKNQDNLLEKLQREKSSLQVELEEEKQESSISKSQMDKKNNELINKIAYQQKTLLEFEEAMNKLRAENEKANKLNFQLVDRKIEELAEEFRKQFEDKYRILSRRIRVAEQLHVENKEWYLRTKETYEEENQNLKEGFKHVKDLSLKANDVLISLDSVALKFEEYTANFLNRISKASCELKFAKDWAMRKNKALLHVKDDLDCLLSQLDDKEAEILIFREKVWKSENKVRELEKMIKEKEDGVIVLQEEKREAIRQLCVWIDYHRSRSDYYKKILAEAGRRKGS